MEEAGTTLRLFALDLVTQIHTTVSKTVPATKDELQAVAGNSDLAPTNIKIY